ncbi:MAG: hypothetical protein IIV56_00390, partial [Mailhella sp.]|nr:hypothetical protein [Mailhella sp.]
MNRNKKQKNNKRKTLCIEKLHYNSILSISELSKALRLDRRTIEEIAYGLEGNCWMARVILDGKQVACKMFPSGKKHGKYWR